MAVWTGLNWREKLDFRRVLFLCPLATQLTRACFYEPHAGAPFRARWNAISVKLRILFFYLNVVKNIRELFHCSIKSRNFSLKPATQETTLILLFSVCFLKKKCALSCNL